MGAESLTASVVVITYERVNTLRRTLESVAAQTLPAVDLIVVDASLTQLTRGLVSQFPNAMYVKNERGYGNMPYARNLGFVRSRGDIVVFLDDDAFPEPSWLSQMMEPFGDPSVGGVGGRALNNQPGEGQKGVDSVGQLTPRGRLTGNFAADTGAPQEVDHVLGCTMGFRRDLLVRLGGFREDMTGPVRDDTDISLRIRELGSKLIFNPSAVVEHVGAPQPKGRRFGVRYAYYSQRNHMAMLIQHFGLSSPMVRAYLADSWSEQTSNAVQSLAGHLARYAMFVFGTLSGLRRGLLARRQHGGNPVRIGADAEMLRQSAAESVQDTQGIPGPR